MQHQPARMRPAHRLILQLGHLGARHFGRRPWQISLDDLLNRLAQLRHHHVGQRAIVPTGQQFGQAEARVGAHAAQAKVPRQVLPQIQKERGRVAAAGGVAGAQPQLGHQPHLGQHRQERMQTRLESLAWCNRRPRPPDGRPRAAAASNPNPACSPPCGWAAGPGPTARADESSAGWSPAEVNP